MRLKQLIYITFGAMLTACSNDITAPTDTVGEADNAIVLRAGINDGSTGLVTRAAEYGEHTKHVGFTSGTQIALRVDGTWTGHSPEDVKTKTVATLGDATNKHNPLNTYSPNIYWDDYGTADPANESTGRAQGLTIYGAAVDGRTTLPTTLSSLDNTVSTWQALSWNVGTPADGKIDQSAGWGDYDLVTSNNVVYNAEFSKDNAYKFLQKNEGKLLEFTHAMTKITVNLTAGKGFPGYENGAENALFQTSPTVTLLGFNYTGTVNVEGKTSTPTASTVSNIKTYLSSGGENSHTATLDALVFPGNRFDDATEIVTLTADGNNYSVTATKLNAAIQTAITNQTTTGYKGTDNTLLQAVNYVINITVNKTDIDVEATIKDWDEVSATNETPVINIIDAYGHEGNGFNKSFDFYRSTAVDGSYLSGITEGNHTVINYGGDPIAYRMAQQMYWPNHSTHYFFRGIWPLVDSKDSGEKQLGPTSSQVKANSIEVANVPYKQGYYPSDLMIGRPRKTDGTPDETCKLNSHDKSTAANGICATEGKVRMNFQYAMSQVIVELTTSTGNDKVIFDENTTVEIIGGYKEGEIKLSDESSDFNGKSVTDYFMHNIANTDYDSYHDAIIPQSLQDGSGNATLKFRITVKSGDSYDKYETVLGIKDIDVTENSVTKKITSWEPGKKYTYTLHITKTGIKVEATIKDWVTVTANENVWF